jgi:hypothetical protein
MLQARDSVMRIIAMCLDHLVQDFSTQIKILRRGEWQRAVLISQGFVLGEINFLSEPVKAEEFRYPVRPPDADETPMEPESDRVTYSKLTGLPVVRAKPGERKVSSEEIYALLDEFP